MISFVKILCAPSMNLLLKNKILLWVVIIIIIRFHLSKFELLQIKHTNKMGILHSNPHKYTMH